MLPGRHLKRPRWADAVCVAGRAVHVAGFAGRGRFHGGGHPRHAVETAAVRWRAVAREHAAAGTGVPEHHQGALQHPVYSPLVYLR